jgi:cellulose synthase/poly-beta-1,6-N-acetylglucosamine synthase-like glycosyltransferase
MTLIELDRGEADTFAIVELPSVARERRFEGQALNYREWLKHEYARRDSAYTTSAHTYYSSRATQPMMVGEQEAMPFAPLRSGSSAIRTMTRGQRLVLGALVVALVLALYLQGTATLIAMLAIITLAYFVNMGLMTVAVARALRDDDADNKDEFDEALGRRCADDALIGMLGDDYWPPYTILCPLYREAEVVPQFVDAIAALDYPTDRLQVLFLTEEDDEDTRQAILRMRLPACFQVVTVPEGKPRTKPRACNYGLLIADGSFTVIYDAEDIPDPLQLKKAVLAFARDNASLACVQASLGFYNPTQNLLTRWFTIEYAVWFRVVLPGLQWLGLSLPLGGTSNHFRTDVLRRVGGWDPFNVTEDCDLGLRLAHLRLRTAILDSTTMEEANSDLRNWLRQRSRWIKGYMQTYLVHLRQPWRYIAQRRVRGLFSLQALIGATPATILINPLMWALLAVYIALRGQVAPMFQILYAPPIFYPAVVSLVCGNFLQLYIHLIACVKIRQYSLIPAVAIIPFYWLLMSVAAAKAVWQLIVMPHYWEKTRHGLHLMRAGAPDLAAADTCQLELDEPEPMLVATTR